jgi:hypothetical protein
MTMISKILSAALLAGLASLVTVAQPSISLACDGEGHAKEEKKKNEDTVAQGDRSNEVDSKKKREQAPSDKRRQGESTNTPRTN